MAGVLVLSLVGLVWLADPGRWPTTSQLVLLAIPVAVVSLLLYLAGRQAHRLTLIVNALRQPDGRVPVFGPAGVLRIRDLDEAEQALLSYHRELSQARERLDEKNRELWGLAHLDALTGAQNRRAFEHFWQTLQSLGDRQRRTMRLMLCDVNRFKAINDTYGHDVGDAVLQGIVHCLQASLRRGEQLFRLGGDEFVCVLLDCDDRQAAAVAARCAREVEAYPFREELGIEDPVGLSIGISPATDEPDTPLNVLLRQADLAMYHSKRSAGGVVTLYRESLASELGVEGSSSANEAVYRAVEQGDGLCLHYQPVLRLSDRQVSYYEALLRIEHGEDLLTPEDILPLVESRQLERELDRAVMDELLRALYSSVIPAGAGVSFNLSTESILDNAIVAELEPFRPFLSDVRIMVEVAESALIAHAEEVERNLMRLRSQGFQVAIDGFGRGYSSLRHLAALPVDIVKFDAGLVRLLAQESSSRLVGHLVDFLAGSGRRTVAEGVEDAQTLERVREAGFACVQGFVAGRPRPFAVEGESAGSAGDQGQ